MKFEDFKLSNELLTTIDELGLKTPTEIQEKSIPLVIEGKDLVGESATGSGKTLAFGAAIIERITPKNGLQALILAPTRELAEQVKDSLRKFSHKKSLNVIAIYGGVSINNQFNEIKKADVVVATPGRLVDHLKRNTINLSKVNILVLDEADRMLDMGFIDDMRYIIKACPRKRQTLFFSATISSEIKRLAKDYMNNPIMVSAENMVDPEKLKQVYHNVERNMKLSLLVHLLKNEKAGLVMVFCNTRRNADFVVKNLKLNKIDAISIHGGLSQNSRTRTIEMFNGAKVSVLVCTDVAARGLHINNVSHIYNYDLPNNPKDYVHRIGRTARAGEEGKVVNLLCDLDHNNFSSIIKEYPSFTIRKMGKFPFERVFYERAEPVERRKFPQRHFQRGNFNNRRPYRRSYSN